MVDSLPPLCRGYCGQKIAAMAHFADCRVYTYPGGVAALRGGQGVVQGRVTPALVQQLKILGARELLLSRPAPGATLLIVLRGVGTGRQNSSQSCYLACKLQADVFNVEFDRLYADTAFLMRHAGARVYYTGRAAATVCCGNIEGVCAAPKGQGYGRQLMQAVLCEEEQLLLSCRHSLWPFYARCGFVPVGRVYTLEWNTKPGEKI